MTARGASMLLASLALLVLVAASTAFAVSSTAAAQGSMSAAAVDAPQQAATPQAGSEAQPPEAPSGWAAFLWWLLIPIGLLLMLAAALSTAKVHPDFIGTFGPSWAVLIKRRAERRRRGDLER